MALGVTGPLEGEHDWKCGVCGGQWGRGAFLSLFISIVEM